MRLPKTITVNGFTVKIKYAKAVVVDGDACYGIYDSSNKTITLVKGMNLDRKKEIFLHEYLHFLEDIYRMKISEEKVCCFTSGLLTLFTETKIDFRT